MKKDLKKTARVRGAASRNEAFGGKNIPDFFFSFSSGTNVNAISNESVFREVQLLNLWFNSSLIETCNSIYYHLILFTHSRSELWLGSVLMPCHALLPMVMCLTDNYKKKAADLTSPASVVWKVNIFSKADFFLAPTAMKHRCFFCFFYFTSCSHPVWSTMSFSFCFSINKRKLI